MTPLDGEVLWTVTEGSGSQVQGTKAFEQQVGGGKGQSPTSSKQRPLESNFRDGVPQEVHRGSCTVMEGLDPRPAGRGPWIATLGAGPLLPERP